MENPEDGEDIWSGHQSRDKGLKSKKGKAAVFRTCINAQCSYS